MTVVRLATRADETDLMRLCRQLHSDNGIFEMDDAMVRAMLHRAFNREGGIIGVIDGKNEIEAALYMLISNFWYSTQHHLEELFSFVREPYRRSTHAAELIKFAERCADTLNLKLLIGVLTSHRMESKVRLYRRELGMPAGAFFVYEPGDASNEFGTSMDVWKMLYGHSRGRSKKTLDQATMTTSAVPMLPVVAIN